MSETFIFSISILLKREVEQLRGALASHNKLFRMLSNRLRQLEDNDNKEVIQDTVQDITEELPEPPLQVYKTPKTPFVDFIKE